MMGCEHDVIPYQWPIHLTTWRTDTFHGRGKVVLSVGFAYILHLITDQWLALFAGTVRSGPVRMHDMPMFVCTLKGEHTCIAICKHVSVCRESESVVGQSSCAMYVEDIIHSLTYVETESSRGLINQHCAVCLLCTMDNVKRRVVRG